MKRKEKSKVLLLSPKANSEPPSFHVKVVPMLSVLVTFTSLDLHVVNIDFI